ncbi:MAG TPA: dNTP triphosphohydrolase [Candidatus Acidoferrum sp.]|jgi:dGTPase
MLVAEGLRLNGFYSDFDSKTWGARNTPSNRTPFQVDRDRITHSYAFRRLQAKTQVFRPGEYDFYRTRLTHTIEVAQIGRSICRLLLNASDFLSHTYHVDEDLVEAVCLAHDLGHPPFGHAGERALNKLMAKFGGFEGNAQTLRLISETMWPNTEEGARQGMAPTRGLLDGVLKYKVLPEPQTRPKKFIYEDQCGIVDFVHDRNTVLPSDLKSLECRIMDWADEIAYSVGDVVDGIKTRFITIDKLRNWKNAEKDEVLVEKLLQAIQKDGTASRFAARVIGDCIEACSLVPTNCSDWAPESNRYKYMLQIDPAKKSQVECLKAIAVDLVFRSPAVEQLEYKAKMVIDQLFEMLSDVYVNSSSFKHHLLGSDVEKILLRACSAKERARVLCDQISGMSDEYAIRMHRRLREPDFGSIADLM